MLIKACSKIQFYLIMWLKLTITVRPMTVTNNFVVVVVDHIIILLRILQQAIIDTISFMKNEKES